MGFLGDHLTKKTNIFGLKLWVDIVIGIGLGVLLILFILTVWLLSRKSRKSRKEGDKLPLTGIPDDAKEIKEVKIDRVGNTYLPPPDGILLTISENSGEKDSAEKMVLQLGFNAKGEAEKYHQQARQDAQVGKVNLQAYDKTRDETSRQGGSVAVEEPQEGSQGAMLHDRGPHHIAQQGGDSRGSSDGERRALLAADTPDRGSNLSANGRNVDSPGMTGPEVSHLGWGHWYTLRELEAATDGFADVNVLGEGGYGIVYRGQLTDGTLVAVKKLLNNSRGQAEKEFRVEVEAIGRVRHKNLVRLLGYCAEGAQHRMLVYEYVDNGNLEQWLHGPIGTSNAMSWDARMRIVMGTAKGLAYLHEALEPKVVHRDIKSSNILVSHSQDGQWNAKVSDFGLAKLLGSGKSHVTTRVMGTFGYVAPEYANTGLLNERSDVYSFGVLLMEIITGRDPVDYGRPAGEVNLVDWLKMMVGNRRSEEVADPSLDPKPTSRALKRALLVALRCVDPDSSKRPKMGQVVHMLEAEDFPFKDDRRISRDSRSRRTDNVNQERILKQLSTTDSPSKPGDEDSDDNLAESPHRASYVKKYRRYEG